MAAEPAPEVPGAARRSRWLLAVKITVTVVLCAVIVWQADWARIGTGLANADLGLVAVVFACMTACVTWSAYKWQVILRIHGIDYSFAQLHRYYFVAMFFNNFLPTSIGGDGYRVYRTLDNSRSRTSAVVAVFVERVSGILSLLLVGFCGALVSLAATGNLVSRTAVSVGIIGIVVGVPVLAVLVRPGVWRRVTGWRRFPEVLRKALQHGDDYRRHPRQSLWVVVISFAFHLFTIWWILLLVRAVGADMAYVDLAVVMAMLSVVAVIPLSINGIGLVDGTFIFLSGQYGLDYDSALTVMLLQRALLVPISLVGAALYFTDRGPGKQPAGSSTVG